MELRFRARIPADGRATRPVASEICKAAPPHQGVRERRRLKHTIFCFDQVHDEQRREGWQQRQCFQGWPGHIKAYHFEAETTTGANCVGLLTEATMITGAGARREQMGAQDSRKHMHQHLRRTPVRATGKGLLHASARQQWPSRCGGVQNQWRHAAPVRLCQGHQARPLDSPEGRYQVSTLEWLEAWVLVTQGKGSPCVRETFAPE